MIPMISIFDQVPSAPAIFVKSVPSLGLGLYDGYVMKNGKIVYSCTKKTTKECWDACVAYVGTFEK